MGDWMAEARNAEETWLPTWLLPKELVWRPHEQGEAAPEAALRALRHQQPLHNTL